MFCDVIICKKKKNTSTGSKARTANRKADTIRTDRTNMAKFMQSSQYIRYAPVPLDPFHISTCQKQYKMRPPTPTMDRPTCDTIRTRTFSGVIRLSRSTTGGGWRGISKSPADGEVFRTALTLNSNKNTLTVQFWSLKKARYGE